MITPYELDIILSNPDLKSLFTSNVINGNNNEISTNVFSNENKIFEVCRIIHLVIGLDQVQKQVKKLNNSS